MQGDENIRDRIIASAITATGTERTHRMKISNTFNVTSNSFTNESMMPSLYTCDGDDISPHLSWDAAPSDAKSFAIACVDPDAPSGEFVHWLVYNIPAAQTQVPEDVIFSKPIEETENDFGRSQYGGPCPPSGTHRYYFTIYALDTEKLSTISNKREFFRAMESHGIAKAQIMGKYARQR